MMQFVDPSSFYQNTFYINSKTERTKTKLTGKDNCIGNNNNERKKECTKTSCSTISCHMCSTRPRYVIDSLLDQYHSFISLVHRLTHIFRIQYSHIFALVSIQLIPRFVHAMEHVSPTMYASATTIISNRLATTGRRDWRLLPVATATNNWGNLTSWEVNLFNSFVWVTTWV